MSALRNKPGTFQYITTVMGLLQSYLGKYVCVCVDGKSKSTDNLISSVMLQTLSYEQCEGCFDLQQQCLLCIALSGTAISRGGLDPWRTVLIRGF